MKKRTKILGIALVLAAILTLTLGSTVFADAPDDADTSAYCGGQGWHGFMGNGGACSEAVSDLLGLTQEELHELRLEGNSLADIAAANGITEDELVATITAEKTEAVEARVADGTLTREQADLMIQRMTERTIEAVNRTSNGPAEWHGGGMNGNGECAGYANHQGGQDCDNAGNSFGYGMHGSGFGGGMHGMGRH